MSWNPAYPPGYGKTTDTDKNKAPVGRREHYHPGCCWSAGRNRHAGTCWTAGYSRTAGCNRSTRLPGTVMFGLGALGIVILVVAILLALYLIKRI